MAEPTELRGYLGPFPVLGTLIDADRKEIERQTGVRASLRAPRKGHSAGQARHLSFNGPPERLREACKMAMVMIEKHGRTGGRKTKEQQRQEQQKAIVKRVSDAELQLAKAKLQMERTCGSSRPSVAAASHVSSCSAECEPKKIDVTCEPKKPKKNATECEPKKPKKSLQLPDAVRLEPSDEPKTVDTVRLEPSDEPKTVDTVRLEPSDEPKTVDTSSADTNPYLVALRRMDLRMDLRDSFSMRPPLPYPIGYGEALPLQPSGSWWTGDFLEPVQYSNGEWNNALAQEWPAWNLW